MPKTSPAARRALTEQRKTQILAAAAKVFAAKGFERATIADIAKAAGIAEGSIYNYFKNKNDLLVSLPRQMLQPTLESVGARLSMSGTEALALEQVLAMMARNMLTTVRSNAHIFRALISAMPSMKRSAREKYLNQVVLYATGVLENYFREQVKQGVFREDSNPRILARVFIGMFFPFVMIREVLQVEEDRDWDDDQVIAEAIPLFLRGVLAEPAERKTK